MVRRRQQAHPICREGAPDVSQALRLRLLKEGDPSGLVQRNGHDVRLRTYRHALGEDRTMTPMMRAADVARYMGGAADRGRGGLGQAGDDAEGGEGMMMDETWPEPRPIAEARPQSGQILAWDGESWHPCRWSEVCDIWWAYDCDTYGLAKRTARLLTHFLPMPPAPKVTP